MTFSNFLYYLSCPSLVYEVSFPKTNSIRWRYFFSLVGQAAATFFIEYLFCQYYLSSILCTHKPS